MAKKNNATAQAKVKAGRGGVVPPVERQFGKPNGNPRNPSGWKKEETARWKFEQIIKMNQDELDELIQNEKAAEFERTCATVVKRARVMAIASEKPTDLERVLAMLERLSNQVYGMPKQEIKQTNIELKPILPKPKKGKK